MARARNFFYSFRGKRFGSFPPWGQLIFFVTFVQNGPKVEGQARAEALGIADCGFRIAD